MRKNLYGLLMILLLALIGAGFTCGEKSQVECPTGCECLTKAQAAAQGYELCQGKEIKCGTLDDGTQKYCYQKPAEPEEAECPAGCYCMTKEAAAERGFATVCDDDPCGYDTAQNPMYCFKQPTDEAECPPGCGCLTEAEATRLGLNQCQGQKIQCGGAAAAFYCYEKPTDEAECPEGCYCMTKEAAEKRGFTDMCEDDPCGNDTAQSPMYCFKQPVDEVQCPKGCQCLTEAEAKRLGLDWCQGEKTACGYDAAGNLLYCFTETQR